MWDPYAEFETTVLSNGLTVHVAHWSHRPWAKMGFVIHSGARHDSVGLEGTAHFVEHLVSRNTVLPYKDVGQFFASRGGGVSLGTTSYHTTKYEFTLSTDRALLKRGLEIFGSMLLSAQLKNFIEVQRQVILGEEQRKYHLPVVRDLVRRVDQTVFGDIHFLGRSASPLGTPESIGRITQGDLQRFYDEQYAPRNISVVCVGGLTTGEVAELLRESPFNQEKAGDRQTLLVPLEDFPAPLENRHVFEFSKHLQSADALESIGFESHAVIPEAAVRQPSVWMIKSMLNRILFEEVREALGWTYDIQAGSHNHQELRVFSIRSAALALDSLDTIESVIDRCIESVGRREDLFEEIKRSDLMSNHMLDLNAGVLRADAMRDLENYQRIRILAEDYKETESLTMSDVREALKWLRPERRYTLLRVP